MKKDLAAQILWSITGILLFIAVLSVQVQASETVIKLKYSDVFPGVHKIGVLNQEWCKEIERRTDGRVKITYFPTGTLTPPPQTYDSVVKGIADIGQSNSAYSAGRFLLTEVLGQPLGYTSGHQATRTCNAFYKKFKPKEFDDTMVMYIHGHGPGMFQTVKPISTLGDIKGKRFRANAECAPIVTAMGASPVTLPITETYDALQKSLVDGVLLPVEALKGWRFADTIRTVIECPPMAYTSPILVYMNRNKWNSLPKDVQEIIEKVNEEWIEKQAKLWDELEKEATEFAKTKGIKIIKTTKEDDNAVTEKMESVRAEWVKRTSEKGLPAQAAMDFCLEYIKANP